MPTPILSKRAPIYADVPDEKWNDWRWQLSNRLNTAEDIEKVLPITDSERKALQTQGLFRVDVTPYFISLVDPDDPNDPVAPAGRRPPEDRRGEGRGLLSEEGVRAAEPRPRGRG